MTSWTSIPFYLWKNTFKRWLEYPVSPFSKILIPVLLGLLATLVLVLFAEIERELRVQLSKISIHTVHTSEFIPKEMAATLLRRTYEEEIMWSARYGSDIHRQVRQPLASALVGLTEPIGVITYTSSLEGLADHVDHEQPPKLWILTENETNHGRIEEVSIGGKRSVAEVRAMPDWVNKVTSTRSVLVAPIEMMESLLLNGFMNHTITELDSIDAVEAYVREVTAYYRAEKRTPKIVSALEILRNLQQITRIQSIVRSLIVVGCGIILALTLGSIAWLEYRQEAYLLALLKSFGTPSWVLLIHMFLENLILVLGGMLFVRTIWGPLYAFAAPHLQGMGLQSSELPAVSPEDLAILLLAGLFGVLLAMLPVAVGLRKPPGLVLQ